MACWHRVVLLKVHLLDYHPVIHLYMLHKQVDSCFIVRSIGILFALIGTVRFQFIWIAFSNDELEMHSLIMTEIILHPESVFFFSVRTNHDLTLELLFHLLMLL